MEIYCGRGAVFMAGSNYSLVESPASKLSSTIHTTGLAGSPEEPLNLSAVQRKEIKRWM